MEDDGFWAWAVVETFRLTGLRPEELAELTQLSLRHYRANTGTLVPLLHIAPSKDDRERLIPMSPELVTVLLVVQHRAKALTPARRRAADDSLRHQREGPRHGAAAPVRAPRRHPQRGHLHRPAHAPAPRARCPATYATRPSPTTW